MKVMTIVGTRPEIIRLSRTIVKLDAACQHILVHTGQNYDYELNEIFFEELGIRKPDYFLNAAGQTASETIGKVIIESDIVLDKEKPDALLILGDTNSALCAIPAKRRKIPIFHMEAGNRCFDSRVPEEINRKIVDHTADINLPYTDIARECLLREGFPLDRVIKTGSPMFEVLEHFGAKIASSDVVTRLGLTKERYFLVSTHREENVDKSGVLKSIISSLNSIAQKHQLPIIVSTHPRTQKRLSSLSLELNPLIKVMKPLGFADYVALQCNALTVISDSGTISEESNILGFRALNLRETQERHEAMEEAAVMMTGLNEERILQCLSLLIRECDSQPGRRIVADYSTPNVSDKVVRLIHSYTSYVNRVVWSKSESPSAKLG